MKDQLKGYIAQDKKTGNVLWSGGYTEDADAVRAAIEFLGSEKDFVVNQVRLVTRAVVHEHVFVYDNAQPELSFKEEEVVNNG